MNVGLRLLTVVAVAACSMPGVGQAQEPVLSGTTSFVAQGQYRTLDGVEVTIYRKAPVAQGQSQNGGRFTVPFPAGPPVYALFNGPNGELPALQSLKADTATKHEVHVTLFTADEAKRQGIRIYAYIKAIVDQLEAVGVNPNDPQLQSLRKLMSTFG